MNKKHARTFLAAFLAAATAAPVMAQTAVPLSVSADQLIMESTFDKKILPWTLAESSPARQNFSLENGELQIRIVNPYGANRKSWDLQLRYSNLIFRKDHEYVVSFDVKATRAGMHLYSKIGNRKGDEVYFDTKSDGTMAMGPDADGQWGSYLELDTEYQTVTGVFKPTKDIDSADWSFLYAYDDSTYTGGNAQAGDELYFDNMSIVCTTCDECGRREHSSWGVINRDNSHLKDNYISVNQIGYLTSGAKTATLGDNKGDWLGETFDETGSRSIDLSGSYDYEIVDVTTDSVVHTGKTGDAKFDPDSGDTVCKIDFSAFSRTGEYYIRIKDKGWRSYSFRIGDDIYAAAGHNLLTDALNYFYQNRSGMDIDAACITSGDKKKLAHTGGHKNDLATVQKRWVSSYAYNDEASVTYKSSMQLASGGWYDADSYCKDVVEGGISLWTLQNMYERSVSKIDGGTEKFADGSGTVVIPENGNDIPDILDECRYELDYMSAMKVKEHEPTWGEQAGLYYQCVTDDKATGLATRPWEYEGPVEQGGWDTIRIIKPPTFAATLNYAACAAQAARLWERYDSDYAQTLLSSAKDAYQAYLRNYYEPDRDSVEYMKENSLYEPYGDLVMADDAYWAACEIFVSASVLGDADAATYLQELSGYENAFKVSEKIWGGNNYKYGSFTLYNRDNTSAAGSLTLALHQELLTDEQKQMLSDSILSTADAYVAEESAQGYSIPYKFDTYYVSTSGPEIEKVGYEMGSNAMILNNLIALVYAYDLSADKTYLDGVMNGVNYIFGNNPLSFSYVTGYGQYKEQSPTHQYWSGAIDGELPMAPDGVLTGGPTTELYDNVVRGMGFRPGEVSDCPNQRCFFDMLEAWSVNRASLNQNAMLAWVANFLQEDGHNTVVTERPNGDVNCDNQTDVADAVLLARYLAEDNTASLTETGRKNADCNKSGQLEPDDIILILKAIARLIRL